MRDISKRLRGGDFRHAVQAVGALRLLDPAERAAAIPAVGSADEQRDFQILVARLVAEGGVAGLAERWRELSSAHWREMLVSEIGQNFDLWAEEDTIELLLVALEDPDAPVQRRAVTALLDRLRPIPSRERRKFLKTQGGKLALELRDRAAPWLTRARRARIARTVTAALGRNAGDPKALLWPDWYIELLGLSATRGDSDALALLEGFRRIAGETRRSELEKLDPDNLPWPTSVLAEGKGIPSGTPFVRVWSKPTGLLDAKGLEEAIARIRATAGDAHDPPR